MNKRHLRFVVAMGLSGVLLLGAILSFKGVRMHSAEGANENLSLTLDSAKRIYEGTTPASGESEGSVQTINGNAISFRSNGVVKNASGWQTILPNGYLYNPITNGEHHNRISGLKSIRYTGTSGSSLRLHYGYSANQTQILYSFEETLSANQDFFFTAGSPSYLYLANDGANAIDINQLSISYSCAEEAFPQQNLKILMVGNSFSDDTIYYVKDAAASYGINLDIHDAYIASCTLNKHYTNIQNGTATYSYRSAANGTWNYQDNKSLTQILQAENWDIITLQQASAEIGRLDTYGNLSALVGKIRDVVGSRPRLLWNQTWAYDTDYMEYYDYFSYFGNDQAAMNAACKTAYQTKVAPTGLFEGMIPAGMAVQNLRTSYMKETFTRDGKHMASVHGRYLLALNLISTLYKIDLKMSPCPYLPPEANASFRNVAYESIENARKSPLDCVNSQYTQTEMSQYDLTGYTEIDPGLVGCSYWNSIDSNYNIRQCNVDGASNVYTSTNRFTSSTLPTGSLVFCPEGFGFRPEAWVSDAQQATRPTESYANVLEIDSSFWSGYAYRAFNIFKAGKTTLLGQYNQIFEGFRIFVPNAKAAGLKTKTGNDMAATDEAIFTQNHLKFDSFERMHLDPIIGFYKCDSYYDLTNSYRDDTAKKFVCTVPFYSAKGDLPANTVLIIDNGYQWRSDCWGDHGTTSSRPANVSAPFTRLDASFMSSWRVRTFNVSSTSSAYVGQNMIPFINHLRIYVPTSDDIELPSFDGVTMSALGYANLNSTAASALGKSQAPVLITLTGNDPNGVTVEVNGTNAGASTYTYNVSTGALSIPLSGSVVGKTFGTLSGIVHPNQGSITNIGITGTFSSYLTNNGSISCTEKFFDRCDYASDAASQNVWQRWYMSGSWQYNTGSGTWTTAATSYTLETTHSMGLRIANSTYYQTRFTLKNDFNSGAGLNAKGISIWLYNPNGNIYSLFRIYVYTSPSTVSGDKTTPQGNQMILEKNSLATGSWVNIKTGYNYTTIYNVSLFFQTSSPDTTYVYLGHVSFY